MRNNYVGLFILGHSVYISDYLKFRISKKPHLFTSIRFHILVCAIQCHPRITNFQVKYKDIEVTPGLELFHNQTTEPPQVTWEGNSTDLYTLYFTGKQCERTSK